MWKTVYDKLKSCGIDVRSASQYAEMCGACYCVATVDGYQNGYERVAVTAYAPLEQYSLLDSLCQAIASNLDGTASLVSVGGDSIDSKVRAHSRTLYFRAAEKSYNFGQTSGEDIPVYSAYIGIDNEQYELNCSGTLAYSPVFVEKQGDYVIIGSRVAAQYDPKAVLIGFDITLTDVVCTQALSHMLQTDESDIITGAVKPCTLTVYANSGETDGISFFDCTVEKSSFGYSGEVTGQLKLRCRPEIGQAAMKLIKAD